MNVYFLAPSNDFKLEDMTWAIRHAMQQKFGWKRDLSFALEHDKEDQFFLKTPKQTVWGRVLQKATFPVIQNLRAEIRQLTNKIGPSLLVCFFFPEDPLGISHLFSDLPGAPWLFEYSFLQSAQGKGVVLRQWVEETPAKVSITADAGLFSRQSSLSREELSELIDLSLQFKTGLPI